jgi:hypothetical protein
MAEIDSKQVTGVINSIPFGNIIGGPLSACVKAQKEASLSTLNYIKKTTMERSEVDYGSSQPVTISFSFQIEGVKKIMVIPLLAIVPIPYINIDEVDLSFTANVTACNHETIVASYTSPYSEVNANTETNTNVQNIIKVDIHASTSQMPAGVAKLLEVFGNQLVQVEQLSPEEAEWMRLRTRDMNILGYISYKHRHVNELYMIPNACVQKLVTLGIKTVEQFLNSASTKSGRAGLSRRSGIEEDKILKWANHSDLMRIPHVSPKLAALLESAGVDTVKELKNRSASSLYRSLGAENRRTSILPALPKQVEVSKMIMEAKKLKAVLQY